MWNTLTTCAATSPHFAGSSRSPRLSKSKPPRGSTSARSAVSRRHRPPRKLRSKRRWPRLPTSPRTYWLTCRRASSRPRPCPHCVGSRCRGRADGVGENPVENVFLDCSEELLHAAVGVDDHKCGLRRHFESGIDLTGIIADLGKGQPVLVDEPLEGGVRTEPGDADEIDSSGPPLARRLDRGGFLVAGGSSRCPKPEGHRVASELCEVQLATTDEWRRELQYIGCRRAGRNRR